MVKCYHQLLYCNRVKAVDPLKLDPTSMSNIYKVIDMLHMQWIEEDSNNGTQSVVVARNTHACRQATRQSPVRTRSTSRLTGATLRR